MLGEDRRLRLGERPTSAIFVTWLCVSVILLAVASTRILDNQYPDPDDALRLAQVRDLLAGQAWYDLHQYRMTPPDGTLMHWSRLVDLPIAGLILFLSLFMEMALAERVTMVVMPLIVLLLTMLVIGRLAWRLFDRQVAIFTCAAMILMPLVATQFQPMRIDHHSWQILSAAIALWAISWRKAAHGGAIAGLAMAAGLIISLETIFLSAGFAGVLAMRWMRDNKQRWWLVSYLQSLALGLVGFFALTRGLPDLASHCDAISPPHLGFFLIVALGSGLLAALPTLPRLSLLMGLGVSGLAGLGFVGWSEPQCLAPPFSGLDPLVRDYWYLNVGEGRPIWFAQPATMIGAIVQPLLGLGIAIFLASRSHDWVRVFWFEYAFVLAVALAGGMLTTRSMAFAGMLCAVPFGWLFWRIVKYWRAHEHVAAKALAGLSLLVLFQPAAFAMLAIQLVQGDAKPTAPRVAQSSCIVGGGVPLLNALEPTTLYSPLDIGPAILLETHHSVVASSHHRAEQAMHDLIDGFTSDEASARRYIDQYQAGLVVVCMDLLEPKNFVLGGGEHSFMAQLTDGDLPDWLEPVDIGGPEELKVWRVIRD